MILTPKIAYCPQWAIEVLVDQEGKVFVNVKGTTLNIPFETNTEYKLMDTVTNMKDLVYRHLIMEKQIQNLKKCVDEGYSSEYMVRYFKEKKLDTIEVEQVNHIITKYGDFLDETVTGRGDWHTRSQAINRSEKSHIERDTERLMLFMEFLKAN